ncbi:immunoglobulin domain-containing protein [Ideonella sp. BN130291]|uniref:immunoglobulin domain-containing protein n=1 Tax=Ideonella sp. BN130291 TaxID=3112940 RepID=UPI002E26E750|nr:immunoglobulin domain-containing protein [Ideonella sp. BN130291]
MKSGFLRSYAMALFALFVLAIAASLSGCGGGGGDDPPAVAEKGSVTGRVLASADSSPVAGATVSIGSASTQSAADGSYTLADVPASERAVVRVQAAGYVDALVSTPVAKGATRQAVARLVREAAAVSFDAAQAGVVTAAGSSARVELPAASLVNAATGAAASGNVSASVTPIDPGADPQTMPGDYTVADGSRIQSFGAIKVKLQDAAGNALQLKAGSQATIRIPLASRTANPPQSIPLYYFDEAAGRWVQEGSATLTGSAPNAYYEGQVSHFTYWNADMPQDTIYVNGCVATPAGQRVQGARVVSQGIDYSGSAYDTTDDQGRFRVAIRKASRASVWAELDRNSNAVVVGPSNTDITLTDCLVLDTTPFAPTIVEPPVGTSAAQGTYAFFSVVASGTRPLRYQWQRNGVDIPGAVYDVLLLTSVTPGDAGTYRVIVSNAVGNVTSNGAVLTVTAPVAPSVIAQPESLSVAAGATASFFVAADGTGPLSYQWLRDGTAIAGAIGAVYTTPATTLADSGAHFQVRVTNAVGSVLSNSVTLTVTPPVLAAPQITTQPADRTAAVGDTTSFIVLATGSPAPTYQWQRNGSPIAGATSASYTTPTLVAGDNGATYSVVVSNSQGSVTSRSATLTVTNDGSTEQKMALMRLMSLSFNFYEAASLPMLVVDEDTAAFVSAASVCSAGTLSATFNGAALPAPGTALPASGTLAATATSCNTGDGLLYSGSTSVNYSFSGFEPANGSATSTVSNVRVRSPATGDAQSDLTANGSATATVASSVSGGQTTANVTLTLASGATLRNELSSLTATFASGNVAFVSVTTGSNTMPLRTRVTYNDLRFAVDGVNYAATGFYELTFSPAGAFTGGSGEAVLSSGGTQVGRIFANASGLFIEVNGVVQPFGGVPRPLAR